MGLSKMFWVIKLLPKLEKLGVKPFLVLLKLSLIKKK